MAIKLYTGKFAQITVHETPIGEGAEGSIHPVIYPDSLQNYVVKLYKNQEKTQKQQDKILYLIKNKPKLKNKFAVIFPEEIVYQEEKFAGYLMKKAPGSHDLTSLCLLGKSTRLSEEWHKKYDRNTRYGMANRMKICYNIATEFNQIHKTRQFTFVDIKPENIKINFNGYISIVDIDSIAIQDGYDLLYPAEKLTYEYSPPEYKDMDLKKDLLDDTWDRFSISVLFYKILFGLHPYAGTCNGTYAELTSNEQKIAEGLFPHGEQAEFFSSIPAPHQKFYEMPKKLRKLFMNTFTQGHHLPSKRPSAQEWCKTLRKSVPKKSFRLPAMTLPKFTRIQDMATNSHTSGPNSTQGILPAFILIGLLLSSAFGFVSYTHQQKMKRLRKEYSDIDQIAEKTRYQERMEFVEHYQSVGYFYNDRSRVLLRQKFGYIDRNGNLITPIQYDWANNFKEERALVKINNLYGYIDTQGNAITPVMFSYAENFYGGMALVAKGHQYYLINKKGNLLNKLTYDAIGSFKEGFASFKIKGAWGFINYQGKEIISANYQAAYPFSQGLAAVKRYGLWGFINYRGQVVIPFRYTIANSFGSSGTARVIQNGITYEIDKTGNILQKINK